MTLSILHSFVSQVPDQGSPSIVGPNDWNASHVITAQAKSILGNNSVSGGPVSDLTILQVNNLLAGTRFGTNLGNPLATSSTSNVAMGLNITFVPTTTGRCLLFIYGTTINSSTGSNLIGGVFGTGTPPTNGSSQVGSAFSTFNVYGGSGAGSILGFLCIGYTTLSVGTTYWLDLAVSIYQGAGTASIFNPSVFIIEL